MPIDIEQLTRVGEVVAWADNSQRQVDDRPKGKHFVAIAHGGGTQSLVIADDGRLELWGGAGSTKPVVPLFPKLGTIAPVKPPTGVFDAAALGLTFFLAVRSHGTVASWGNFLSGAPVNIPTGLRASEVAAASEHGVILLLDGTLKSLGTLAAAPVGQFKMVRARGDYAIALRADRRLYGWGGGMFSTLPGWTSDGAGHFYIDGPFSDIAAGVVQQDVVPVRPHVIALRDNGAVIGWGANAYGETTAPSGVVFESISAGRGYSLGLDTNGKIHHWGNRWDGTTLTGTPINGVGKVPRGKFISVNAGSYHATAIADDRMHLKPGPDAIEGSYKPLGGG